MFFCSQSTILQNCAKLLSVFWICNLEICSWTSDLLGRLFITHMGTGGSKSKHVFGSWTIPPLIVDEEAYRHQVVDNISN